MTSSDSGSPDSTAPEQRPVTWEEASSSVVEADTSPSDEEAAGIAETGDVRVDAALRRLGDVDALPTDEHAAIYEDVHRRLRDALAGDERSANDRASQTRAASPELAAGEG